MSKYCGDDSCLCCQSWGNTFDIQFNNWESMKQKLQASEQREKLLVEAISETLAIIAHACPDTYSHREGSEMITKELFETLEKYKEMKNGAE